MVMSRCFISAQNRCLCWPYCLHVCSVLFQNIAEAYKICHYVFMILPQYAFGSGLVELKVNQMVTDIMMYFNEMVYKNPFSKDMLYWNYVAMVIQGIFFFILAIIIDACYRARAR